MRKRRQYNYFPPKIEGKEGPGQRKWRRREIKTDGREGGLEIIETESCVEGLSLMFYIILFVITFYNCTLLIVLE